MQKLVNGVWINIVDESELSAGDTYRIPVGQGGWQQQVYVEPTEPVVMPTIQLSNFTVRSGNEEATPQGGIYWIGTGDKLEVTADVVDTDDILASVMSDTGKDTLSMVIITQEVFNGDYSNVKDSTRFKVDIVDNVMTLVSNKGFGASGNYIVTKERLNLGLDNINAPFHTEMDTIEFDVLNG